MPIVTYIPLFHLICSERHSGFISNVDNYIVIFWHILLALWQYLLDTVCCSVVLMVSSREEKTFWQVGTGGCNLLFCSWSSRLIIFIFLLIILHLALFTICLLQNQSVYVTCKSHWNSSEVYLLNNLFSNAYWFKKKSCLSKTIFYIS